MKEIREKAGISRAEMAKKLNITPQSVWKIESNRCWPKKKTIDTFCAVTSTPLARLFFRAITEEDFKTP